MIQLVTIVIYIISILLYFAKQWIKDGTELAKERTKRFAIVMGIPVLLIVIFWTSILG